MTLQRKTATLMVALAVLILSAPLGLAYVIVSVVLLAFTIACLAA